MKLGLGMRGRLGCAVQMQWVSIALVCQQVIYIMFHLHTYFGAGRDHWEMTHLEPSITGQAASAWCSTHHQQTMLSPSGSHHHPPTHAPGIQNRTTHSWTRGDPDDPWRYRESASVVLCVWCTYSLPWIRRVALSPTRGKALPGADIEKVHSSGTESWVSCRVLYRPSRIIDTDIGLKSVLVKRCRYGIKGRG